MKNLNGRPADLNELAHAWAETLDKGEGDIPALIKHLPDPEQAQKNAVFLNSFTDLHRRLISTQYSMRCSRAAMPTQFWPRMVQASF